MKATKNNWNWWKRLAKVSRHVNLMPPVNTLAMMNVLEQKMRKWLSGWSTPVLEAPTVPRTLCRKRQNKFAGHRSVPNNEQLSSPLQVYSSFIVLLCFFFSCWPSSYCKWINKISWNALLLLLSTACFHFHFSDDQSLSEVLVDEFFRSWVHCRPLAAWERER